MSLSSKRPRRELLCSRDKNIIDQTQPLTVSDKIFNDQLKRIVQSGSNIVVDGSNDNTLIINALASLNSNTSNEQANQLLYYNDLNSQWENTILQNLVSSSNTSYISVSSDANNKLVINPLFDLTYASEYQNPTKTYVNGEKYIDYGLFYRNVQSVNKVVNWNENALFYIDSVESVVGPQRIVSLSKRAPMLVEMNSLVYPSIVQDYFDTASDSIHFDTNNSLLAFPQSCSNKCVNHSSDYTLVVCGEFNQVDAQNNANTYLSFEGNDNIFEISLNSSPNVDSLVFNCGEVHKIPLKNGSRGILVIRMAQVNSIQPVLDVFFNGLLIYKSLIQNTSKSQGVGGKLYLNSLLGTANVDNLDWNLAYFSLCDHSLSNQDVFNLTNWLNIEKKIYPKENIFNLELLTTSVDYNSNENVTSASNLISDWGNDSAFTGLNLSNSTTLTQPTLETTRNSLSGTIANPYKIKITANSKLETSVQTSGYFYNPLTVNFSILLNDLTTSEDVLLTLVDGSSNLILYASKGLAVGGVSPINFKLYNNSTQIGTLLTIDYDSNDVSQPNAEYVCFLTVTNKIVSLFLSSISKSTSKIFLAENTLLSSNFKQLKIGNDSTQTGSFSLASINVIPRVLSTSEINLTIDSLKTQYSLQVSSLFV